MGILDEAIREHLELKRQHGADETELDTLESEAFGPADRPDAAGAPSPGEAETQIISPGSSVTAPAGEGDQLDKVFEATRQSEADEAAAEARTDEEPKAEATAPPQDPEATFAEHPVPEPPAPSASATPEVTEAATVESPEAKPEPVADTTPEPPAPAPEGDAGDMLEAERHHLSSHPTEHYDVDAAIAEEEEIDILSESSLSDELDRALESGEVESAGQTVEYQMPAEEDSGEFETEEPDSAEFEPEFESAPEPEPEPEPEPVADEEDSAELLYQDAAAEEQPVDEPDTGEEETEGSSDFFDQDDVLEATPEFLEETPEHDRLWFEQKEPKDFDFGD
jgi:hypothetical protein